MIKRIFFAFSIFILTSCSSIKQKVNILSNGRWNDIFANHSGENLLIEVIKKSFHSFKPNLQDSTRIRVCDNSLTDNSPNLPPPNASDDGIISTKSLDITLDGSTKLFIVPKKFKIISITSQQGCYLVIKKGYKISRTIIKIKNNGKR